MQAAVAPADLPPADVAPGPTTVDWEAVALAYNRRVVVHLLARGLPLHDAEEVAQRTWTRLLALDSAGRLARIELPGLAFAQARFLAATLRREQHGEREVGAEALELVVDERADAERTMLARDRVARALAELERSPSSALQVFRRLLDDPPPTHAAIAKQVGLSEQRVRQIVCETRARLRRALEETR